MKILNHIKGILQIKKTNKSLVQAAEVYKTLIESSDRSIFVLDKNRCIIGVYSISKMEKEIASIEDIKGKYLSFFIDNQSSPFNQACTRIDEVFDNVLETGIAVEIEYKILESHLKAMVSRIKGEQILIQIQDITDIVKQISELESNSYKELSMALTAGGLTSWNLDVETRMLSSTHNNTIIKGEMSFDDLVHDQVAPEYQTTIFKLIDDIISHKIQHGEITIKHIDAVRKETSWTNIHAIPHVYGKNGEVKTIVGSQKDVTSEYKYNKEIARLNKQNELILDNIKSGLVYITPKFRVIWENVQKVFNDPTISHYYRTNTFCYEAFNRDSPCVKCVMQEAMISHKPVSHDFTTESGLSVDIMAIPLMGADEVVEGVVLRIDDVTIKNTTINKLQETQQEALELNGLLSTILENLPSSLFVKNVNDNYRYIIANKQYCENLGLTEKDIVGKTDYDLFSVEEASLYRETDIKTIQANCPMIYNGEEVSVKDGTAIWHTIKAPLINVNDNNKKLVVGIGVDITESRKAYEELMIAKTKAEESDRLKSAFLANMSHEIRTPLNAIVGFSELMQSCEDEEDKEEYMRIITANNDLLLRLINDILDLSKLESGIIQLQNAEFDLAIYCDEYASSIKHQIINPDIEFIVENPYESCLIETDQSRMTQIWSNFMTNAVKYTVSGSIKMGYKYINEGIVIYVEDTGVGIPEEKKSRVFSRFEKLDSFAQGTGLGLSICKAISELDGGRVGFESTEGKGSIFWSWRPMKAKIIYKTDANNTLSPFDKIEINKISDIESYFNGFNCKILVAEDNDSNYFLVSHILKKNFQVFRAINGIQAVEYVKNNAIDLILMDMKMPEMDGLEATQEIRKFNQDIAIIALTANAFDSDYADAMNSGCNEFITKPVRKDALLNAMYRICKKKKINL